MNIRTCAALLLAVGLPTAVFAVDFPELEPNETKANALTNGPFVLSSGDTISGITTGTATAAATTTATADTFLVRANHPSNGIYRHRLTITTAGTVGHTGTIRGLTVSGGVINATSDTALQTTSTSTTPMRYNQWYGMGNESEILYRITGGASTTSSYLATMDTIAVTPTAFPMSAESGSVRVAVDAATDLAYDTLTYLYDANFNPIAGWDDSDTQGMTATLAPGTYYYSVSRYNGHAGRFPRTTTSSVLDYANSMLGTSATSTGTLPVTAILDDVTANAITATGSVLANGFDVAWFTFTVVPPSTPTNPTGVGVASPSTIQNDGVAETTLRVTVTPGQTPVSSFLTTGSVTVDGTTIGGGTITLLDNGVAPDTVAGDLIFAANTTVAPSTPGGAVTLPFLITDDQSRTATGSIALTVTTPPPGCAPGLATLTYSGVFGNSVTIGDPSNSLVTGDFGLANINQITITGRFTANSASYRDEARVRMTAPDGSFYDVGPFTGAPASSGIWDVVGQVVTFPELEAGPGTWSFEFYEDYNDTVTPDCLWAQICFAADLTATNPTGVGAATPALVHNDGAGVATFAVTVTPGTNPASTFASSGTVTLDGSLIGAGTLTLLDNGIAPDAIAGDLVFTANGVVASGTAIGTVALPFAVTDDQGRSASGTLGLRVVDPSPACPSGLATLTFQGVQSDGAVADPENSIVTGDFGVAGQINTFHITGQLIANTLTPYNLEARVSVTAPSGNIYLIQPVTTTPSISPRLVTDFTYALPVLEDGTGTWTFEFYESYNDGTTPDNYWAQICFGADLASTPIVATDTSTPTSVVRDGVGEVTLAVTVTPGDVPASTGLAVVVDASSVGGSSSLALADDGNAPDMVAGDNIFTGLTSVAYTTALGTATLPYTVSDDQTRSFAGSLNFTVAEATGACCVESGCVRTTIGDCLDLQGGTFAGNGTACITPTALTTEGAGDFEDISTTGSPVAFGDVDDGVTNIVLPFVFNYFGTDYTGGYISTNGNFQFGTNNSTSLTPGNIPSGAVPNNALYVLWDDLDLDAGVSQVFTETLGTIGTDARFIIQWTNAGQYTTPTSIGPSTFQIVLFEDGSFEFRYQDVAVESAVGDLTIIGFENADGTIGYQSPETRDTLNVAGRVSFRANSTLNDTGVCGPTCPPCAADYDGNGGVDGGDLAAFFSDFEAGEGCADVDGNGGVDGGDLGYFFFVFEQGGC